MKLLTLFSAFIILYNTYEKRKGYVVPFGKFTAMYVFLREQRKGESYV